MVGTCDQARDSYVGCQASGPNGLFFVVNDRVRKPFPLRCGSVYIHDPAFSIGRHDYPARGRDLAGPFGGYVEGLVIYLRVRTHVRVGIAGYLVIFAVEFPFPLDVDGLSVRIGAVSRYLPPATAQPLRVIDDLIILDGAPCQL